MTDEVRSLREALIAAAHAEPVQTEVATRPTDYAKPMPPHDGTPPHAVDAYKNITRYGEAYALFLERSGDEVLAAAQEYKDYCYHTAAKARDEYKLEAERAFKFIEDIQRRGKALDAVRRGDG